MLDTPRLMPRHCPRQSRNSDKAAKPFAMINFTTTMSLCKDITDHPQTTYGLITSLSNPTNKLSTQPFKIPRVISGP